MSEEATTQEPAAYTWERPTVDWEALVKVVADYRRVHGENWNGIYVKEAGEGSLEDLKHFSHPSVVIAPKNSVAGGNIVGSLFRNNAGHTKLLVVHNPGQSTGITAVMDVEVTIEKNEQIEQVFGAAQKGAALAIDYCIQAGILPQDPSVREGLVIGVEAYVDKAAEEFERTQDNFMVALINAIVSAVTGMPSIEEGVAACAEPHVFAPDVKPLPGPGDGVTVTAA